MATPEPLQKHGIVLDRTSRLAVEPAWGLSHVSAGDSYAGIGSAYGDTFQFSDEGTLVGLALFLPDARLPMEIALHLTGLPTVSATLTRGSLGAWLPDTQSRATVLPQAIVASSLRATPTHAVAIDLGNDVHLAVSNGEIVGWMLWNPFDHLKEGELRGPCSPSVALSIVELLGLRDENIADAMMDRASGFVALVEGAEKRLEGDSSPAAAIVRQHVAQLLSW